MRWAKRCRDAFVDRDGYALFGITQGSTYPELREKSADILKDLDFPAMPLAAWRWGRSRADVQRLGLPHPHLPVDKPRYLMGVGTPHDLWGP